MFIDGHRHIGFGGVHGHRSMQLVLEDMQSLGIDRTVVLPLNEPPTDMSQRVAAIDTIDETNRRFIEEGIISDRLRQMRRHREDHREIRDAVEQHPDKLIGIFMINPWLVGTMLDEAEHALDHWGFRGLKLHPVVNGYPADHEVVDPVLSFAQKRDVPVMFHTSCGYGSGPKRMGRVAARFPDVRIVLYHAGMDWNGLPRTEDAIAVANEHRNVWIDLADAAAECVQAIVDRVPSDRVVFGSDDPFGNLQRQLERTNRALGLRESERQMILGRNMAEVLRI